MVTTTPEPGRAAPSGTESVPVPRPAPSVRGPALIVLGIAVFIVVTGVVASALASGNAPTTTVRSIRVNGADVALTPATVALRPIVTSSEPPADILGNLAVPAGSHITHVVNIDQGQSQFDRTVLFTTQLPSDEVVGVFRTVLPRLGWRVIYSGPGAGRAGGPGTEVLAKHGSGDGFYWEVGAVASATTPGGTTPYSVEVFELPDDSS